MTWPVATAEEAGGTVTVLQKRCRVEGEWGVLTGSSSGGWIPWTDASQRWVSGSGWTQTAGFRREGVQGLI